MPKTRWVVQNPEIFTDAHFRNDAVIGPVYGAQVATVYTDSEHDKTNAYLIAAAPDMLEALEAVLSEGTEEEQRHARRLAMKAVAKARGES